MVDLSIILPVYNEEESIVEIHSKITNTLTNSGKLYEIIYVDDGSKDRSFEILSEIAKADERVKVIQFRRNFGQTAAIAAGFDYAQGEILIPMDADLQNAPEDIPNMIEKINEGYDVVSGWRKNRKDKLITRRIPSFLANKLISWVTGVHLHDYGCTLKAYRKEIIKDIKLYGEMHRFIPVYAFLAGGKVTELVVNHYPRVHGQTKYGISRTLKVILDLFTVKFLLTFSTKPIYLFGGIGLILLLVGILSGGMIIFQKIFFKMSMIQSPLLLLTTLCLILSTQFILIGLLAEIIIRIYHESQTKSIYLVKKSINIGRG